MFKIFNISVPHSQFPLPLRFQVTWVARTLIQYLQPTKQEGNIGVSYLPLSHIAAQIADIYMPIENGSLICFAQPDALKGSLLTTLREVQPTLFFGVPRYYLSVVVC